MIATPCFSPPDMVATTLFGWTAAEVKPMCSLMRRAHSAFMRSTSMRPSRVRNSRPMNMLRHIGCFSQSARS
ncbi:MAG TPA: hypothetical protein VEH77_17230 [Roseiarcus sp.]|nr:hypothetical protein [Roseiarcus sp.]